ncbi:MAG TPA: hypothetical protein PK765_07370 [bacterium]|nr:hypothetical protein [bacterium]
METKRLFLITFALSGFALLIGSFALLGVSAYRLSVGMADILPQYFAQTPSVVDGQEPHFLHDTFIVPVSDFFSRQEWLKKSGKTGIAAMTFSALVFAVALLKIGIEVLVRYSRGRMSLAGVIGFLFRLAWFATFGTLRFLVRRVIRLFLSAFGRKGNADESGPRTPFGRLFSAYVRFLRRATGRGSFSETFWAHRFFFWYFFRPASIPSEGKSLVAFRTPPDQRGLLDELNTVVSRALGEKNYIRDLSIRDDVVTFCVTENDLSGEETKAGLLGCAEEIRRALPGYSKDGSDFGEIIVETHKDRTVARFAKKALWLVREPDPETLAVPKGHVLLGFYPEVRKDRIVEVPYSVPTDSLLHSFVVGTTQHGKDVLVKNLVFSLLRHVSEGRPYELHFFDSKESDGQYLDGLASF